MPLARHRGIATVALCSVAWILLVVLLIASGPPFADHWPLMVAMVLGSFVAGVSAAGGGAVAFPVLTLLLGASPSQGRDFAIAIQSVGMTAAALLILLHSIPIASRAIAYAVPSGIVGVAIGLRYVQPLLDPRSAKLAFGTIWFAFAIALLVILRQGRAGKESVELDGGQGKLVIVCASVLGGILTSCFGSGADLTLFSLLVLSFGLCEKVGTPTSVVVMAALSLVTAAMRFTTVPPDGETMARWQACVPVVVIGAPFGAYVCSRLSRRRVTYALIFILVVQFIGTIFVLRPSSLESTALVLVGIGALLFFRWLGRARQHDE